MTKLKCQEYYFFEYVTYINKFTTPITSVIRDTKPVF